MASAATLAGAITVSGAPSRVTAAPRAPGALQPRAAQAQDWPTYLHDSARSSASADSLLTPANVPSLVRKWEYTTGGIINASPAVVGGVVYVGSWDGNEYALNGSTGAVIWQTPLGTTQDPVCVPPNLGITSSATVVNGVVYVGGGDAYWYALDAATGAVLWRVFTGDNTQAGAHYNWSSPLVVGNFAYIGIASNCDAPLVQGQLLKVDLTTHQVVGTASMVPDGQVGGGIWTSPTYDSATNTIFVSTGTLNLYSQQLSQAVVSIDAGTMAVRDHWQLPFEAAVSDSDWGTTPTLTVDSNGRQLVSLANKNGILYTLLRGNLAAGPVWQRQIAFGGDCPTCGDGSIASGIFANGVLYYSGGANVDANGVGHGGSVRAFDPGTGNQLWYHGTNQPVVGTPVYANGVIFDPQGQYMEAIDASNGNAIWDYQMKAPMYAAPAISNGILYAGGVDRKLHAFGLPATPTPPPPADPNCPSGFTCQDIGNTGFAGSEQVNSDGSVTVTAAGDGRNAGDEMRIITTPASGDFQVSVQDVSQTPGNLTGYQQPQLGIVIRQSSLPGAPFYVALQDPTYPAEGETVANVIMYYREFWNGPVVELTQNYPQAFPRYLMVQRHADTFQTLFSTNGVNYTLISGTVHTVVMPTTVLAGMGIAAGTRNATTTAVYNHFAIGPPTTTYIEQNEAHQCPSTWTCTDVGAGSPIGDQTLVNGTWTLQSGGTGITGTSDVLHLAYQKLSGDGTLTAHLTSLGNAAAQAQAAVLMRADDSMASPYYGIVVNPDGTTTVQWRLYNGIKNRLKVPMPTQAPPAWYRLNRYTDTAHTPATTYYSALTSSDGTTWTEVAGSTVEVNLGPAPIAGIGGSSPAGGKVLNQSTWDNVAVASSHIAPPGICPATFTCTDIGTGYMSGSQTYDAASGAWTFQAGGTDIWDVYDTFRFAYQPLAADGTFSARVVSEGPANPASDTAWQKSGVLLRQTTDPQSPYYGVFVTPQHGIVVQWRSTQGGLSSLLPAPAVSPQYPVYLMVGRWRDPHANGATYYTAYTSTDNRNFTAVPGSTMAMTMPGTLLAGIAADSRDQKVTLPVTFDNTALFDTEPVPPGACPTSMTGCADIGGATPAGTQTLSGGVLTMTGGGGDIWAGADQFHLDWQTLAADGVVSAHVASQQNTGPWAKAGVMLRASTDASSPYYGVFVTPSSGIAIQYRTTAGANTAIIQLPGAAPAYLQAGRFTDSSGTTSYTAYTSPDGVTWTAVAGSTVALAMPGPLLAGWAAGSHDQAVAGQVTMDSLAVSAGSTAPPGACPSGWSCADIGGATPAGGQNNVNGTWTIQGGGGDIWATSDQFHLISQAATKDGTVSTQVSSQQNTNAWAKAGVMMRATTDPTSPYYGAFVTPSNGLAVQWRATAGATTNILLVAGSAPMYLQVSRFTDSSGSYYTASTSNDGTTWTPVAGSTVALALGPSFLAGVAVTSHNTTALSAVTAAAARVTTTTAPPPGACPAGWSCADIGGATPAGTNNDAGGTWTIQGGGGDIWGTADQFHLISQAATADGTVSAQVGSQQNTNPWAKAGVMMRASSDPASPYYGVFLTPANGLIVQWRANTGAATSYVMAAGSTPLYLQVSRWTDSSGATPVTYYTALTSSDGTTWTAVAGSTTALSLGASFLEGVAVTSHNPGALSTVVAAGATTATGSNQPAGVCPATYACADIGGPTPAGTQGSSAGTWTVQAGGADIWGTSDQFRLISRPLPADGGASARITSLTPTNQWTKAGVMLRASADPAAPYYALFLTPGFGLDVQFRTAAAATTSQVLATGVTAPIYLRVTRTGTTFAAYTSADGTTWTVVPGSSTVLPGLTGTLLAGLAVTSHDSTRPATATFDHLTP